MAQDMAWLDDLFIGFDQARSDRNTERMRQEAQDASAQDTARAARQRCTKCGGTGTMPQYMHRHHGTCYRCGGTGRLV